MPVTVFSVGQTIPENAAHYVTTRSEKSLLDADVILFWPTFDIYHVSSSYAGRSVISEDDSADIVQDCQHWRDELRSAVNAGKVVFIFLTKPDHVYYDTGKRSYSGTGR